MNPTMFYDFVNIVCRAVAVYKNELLNVRDH